MKLKPGMVAVVTGAANGLGLALAHELAAHGLTVALVDRDEAALNVAVAELLALGHGAPHSATVVDLADRDALRALPGRLLAQHGQIDLLVNNAGVSVGGALAELQEDDIDWILDVNLRAAMVLTQGLLPQLQRRPEAAIVNLSSTFGMLVMPTKTLYCATKFGLRGFTAALRAELSGGPVQVSCALPGAVATDIVRRSRVARPQAKELEHAYLQAQGQAPAAAAARIVLGIERGEGEILVGGDARLVDWLTRLLPRALPGLLVRHRARFPFLNV
ncbi:MAG: SDR family oxidoreductase [Deltaproteobacteria bacterium]|nr:SDR family oxidoreductase [Deltaproteobacteria bacterium]